MPSLFRRRKEKPRRPRDGPGTIRNCARLRIAINEPAEKPAPKGCSMRLDQEEQSSNVEDRRGARFSPGLATGGIGTLAIVLIGLFFGIDPTVLHQGTRGDTNAPAART